MKKTNIKTSLSITLNPNGSSHCNLKWSDLDAGHRVEASERIIAALTNFPDYDWLFNLVHTPLHDKYCAKCALYDENKPCEDTNELKPFPYCFSLPPNP